MLALWAAAGFAQVGEANDSIVRLNNVTVEAGRGKKEVRSTAPIHRIDREKLTVAGITDISDAIHRLPGTVLRDYGGAGGLKTVSVRGFGAGHTGVVYDGVMLSDCQSGQIDLSRYSLDNVGELSLTIGDNDDIFVPARAAASAATFAISSMPIGERPFFTAQMRFGSFGYLNPFVRGGGNVSENLRLSGNLDFVHTRNDYPFTLVNGKTVTRERRNNSLMNSGHGEIGADWKISDSQSLSAKIYGYHNGRQLPGPIVYYNSSSHERLRESNVFAQALYRNRLSQILSLRVWGKFDWSGSLYMDTDGKYPGGELNQHYWQREYYLAGALLINPWSHWSFDYSADWAYNNLNSNLKTDTKPRRTSILQSATARYSNGRLTAMARVLLSIYLNSALKGDNPKNATRLSPSASLSYRILTSEALYFRAGYKSIFRMPSFNEAYFDHYGSLDVLPETTEQLNVGFTWQLPSDEWLSSLVLTADGYMNSVKDKIVAVPYNMFVWRVVNLGKVRVFGLDVTLNSKTNIATNHSLTAALNYSYQRAQVRTSPESREWMKQVAYTPLNSGSASLGWENPWVNLTVHGTAVSARFTTNDNLPATRIKGYAEFGTTLWRAFRLRKYKIELRADLINMLDKQYEVVARYPMPGRSWQATVKFEF